MVLPDKHISFAESLLGFGSYILENLLIPKDVDMIWRDFEKVRGKEYPAFHSFDNLVLTINMLYTLGAIELDKDSRLIRRCVEGTTCTHGEKLCA